MLRPDGQLGEVVEGTGSTLPSTRRPPANARTGAADQGHGLLRTEARYGKRLFQLGKRRCQRRHPCLRPVLPGQCHTQCAGVQRRSWLRRRHYAVLGCVMVILVASWRRSCMNNDGGEVESSTIRQPARRHIQRARSKMAGLGIFTQALAMPLLCDCFDWSQQRPHLGGRAGCWVVSVVPAIELDQPGQRVPRLWWSNDVGLEEIARLAAL